MMYENRIYVKFGQTGSLELDFENWLCCGHSSKRDLKKLLDIFIPEVPLHPENMDAVEHIDEAFPKLVDKFKEKWHKASVKYQEEYRDPEYMGNILKDEAFKKAKPGTKKYAKTIVAARKRIERKNKSMVYDVKRCKSDYMKICELHGFYKDYKVKKLDWYLQRIGKKA